MTKTKVNRVVRGYSKVRNTFLEEIPLEITNIQLKELQNLFNVEESNPMYDCYPISTKEQKEYFEDKYNFNFYYMDYFLEADAVN